ncbi:DUF3800 domain-containing protein [Erythrobacter crassostreae]|uniref:DUF3800 domain-containing protein n=1 Tax=Erythrobacter crassostreae TaxID=2828328 RepID=A0A9X1F3K3_9SPHN|nr:DUF3800 domain-containing protein [Erythrobacter crassostrea]
MTDVTVFIDEAGDPGVRDGLKHVGSRHEWLCVSAFVVRSCREKDVVGWVKECRNAANSTQSGSLHFHKIAHERRAKVCETLASNRCRTFTVASHKTNMREYVNPKIQKMVKGGTFYNWCLRLLLERVTAWVEHLALREGKSLAPMKVVFAERGHDWDHFFSYVDRLEMQSRTDTLFLKGPGLNHILLNRKHWETEKAEKLAGLQCADVVASAFYQAANASSPSFDPEPAKALNQIVTKRHGIARNVGLTVFPLQHQAKIPEGHRQILEFYGYEF